MVDLIVTCLTHPAVANQTFLASDGENLSTIQLLRRMGAALGQPARLISVPVRALKLAAALVGKPELAQRLCGSLQIDMSKKQELLGTLCITPAGLWYADRDGPQGVFLQPIAPLLARKTTRRTARARVATDRPSPRSHRPQGGMQRIPWLAPTIFCRRKPSKDSGRVSA